MKIKDLERVIFTPGVCRESLTSDYYEVGNTIVAGLTGSGKTTTIQALVNSIINSNEPVNYSLMYFDAATEGNSPFCNKNRIITSMALMKDFNAIELPYEEKIKTFLGKLLVLSEMGGGCNALDHEFIIYRPKLVIAIDGFDRLDISTQKIVFAIARNCSAIKFIIGVQSVRDMIEYLYLFPFRLVTRTIAEESNAIMGCNLGYIQADDYGSCWFYNTENPYSYKRYSIDFMEDSLINRNLKVHSGYKGPEHVFIGVLREGMANYHTYVQIGEMKYKCKADTLVDTVVSNVLDTVVATLEYGVTPILGRIRADIIRKGLSPVGRKSIYNNSACERAMRKTAESEMLSEHLGVTKDPADIQRIYESLVHNLAKERILYHKIDKAYEASVASMKKFILEHGMPSTKEAGGSFDKKSLYDDAEMKVLEDTYNSLSRAIARKCVNSLPDDYGDYPDAYQKKYIEYLSSRFGVNLIEELLAERFSNKNASNSNAGEECGSCEE